MVREDYNTRMASKHKRPGVITANRSTSNFNYNA